MFELTNWDFGTLSTYFLGHANIIWSWKYFFNWSSSNGTEEKRSHCKIWAISYKMFIRIAGDYTFESIRARRRSAFSKLSQVHYGKTLFVYWVKWLVYLDYIGEEVCLELLTSFLILSQLKSFVDNYPKTTVLNARYSVSLNKLCYIFKNILLHFTQWHFRILLTILNSWKCTTRGQGDSWKKRLQCNFGAISWRNRKLKIKYLVAWLTKRIDQTQRWSNAMGRLGSSS